MKKRTIDLTDEIISVGTQRGIGQLVTEDLHFDGRIITVRGRELINFGSYSYLGLELDQRLKDAAIDGIQRYGIQYPSSRTYVSSTLYTELESLLQKMFDAPVLLATSTTIGHQAVMPIVVEEGDAIVMDQQVHTSVQDVALKMQLKNVPVTVIRHNHLNELEKKIEELSGRFNRIWYMIDGVYSMYGDCAPMEDIMLLVNKHKCLHIYVDDAHGMSWAGKHGTGYVLSKVNMHPRMILATSLNKAFAAGGSVFVIPNQALCEKVRRCGGPLIFAGQHQTSALAASIACARIHLSSEIEERQGDLREKIKHCNKLLKEYNLPHIVSDSPIFFVGLGLAKVGYNMVKRMMDEGLYVNLAIFPAVPETCTGVRFSITWHHTFSDIEQLVMLLAFNFKAALLEEDRTLKDIQRAFRKIPDFFAGKLNEEEPLTLRSRSLVVEHQTHVHDLNKEQWNRCMRGGTFDFDGLAFLEDAFSGNDAEEYNWDFDYFIVRDDNGKILAATFFTTTLMKDDAVSSANVSSQVEQERAKNPYYLTSRSMIMGSLLSLGKHIYLDRTSPDWKRALLSMMDAVTAIQEKREAVVLNLRDFDAGDTELREFFMDNGMVKVELPANHVYHKQAAVSRDEYLASLKHSHRYYINKNAAPFERYFDVTRPTTADQQTIDRLYKLYQNVEEQSFELNGFQLPKSLFSKILQSPGWETIVLKLKPEFDHKGIDTPIGMAMSYRTADQYAFLITGMDYEYLHSHKLYAQILWQIMERANATNAMSVVLGLTASQNKRKFGAVQVEQVAYLQMKDNFSAVVLNTISEQDNVVSTVL